MPVPDAEPGLDWEVELAVVVGETLTAVTADARPPGAVLGYTVFNDVSARDHQMATSQWANGKNADQSGPVGSTIVTTDALDVSDLRLTTTVNDQVMQDGTTADMVINIPELLAYASRTITLRPGDLIATGTPAGVGFRRDPPVLLHPGDVVTVEVEAIGSVRHRSSTPPTGTEVLGRRAGGRTGPQAAMALIVLAAAVGGCAGRPTPGAAPTVSTSTPTPLPSRPLRLHPSRGPRRLRPPRLRPRRRPPPGRGPVTHGAPGGTSFPIRPARLAPSTPRSPKPRSGQPSASPGGRPRYGRRSRTPSRSRSARSPPTVSPGRSAATKRTT